MKTNRVGGFTLVEMIVVVAIIAILVAIAIPNYREHTKKARRAEAQQFLLDIAQKEEQYLLDARAYCCAGAANAAAMLVTLGVDMPQRVGAAYTLTITVDANAPPPDYTLKLAANAGGAMEGDGDIYLNNKMQRWRETDDNATPDTTDPKW